MYHTKSMHYTLLYSTLLYYAFFSFQKRKGTSDLRPETQPKCTTKRLLKIRLSCESICVTIPADSISKDHRAPVSSHIALDQFFCVPVVAGRLISAFISVLCLRLARGPDAVQNTNGRVWVLLGRVWGYWPQNRLPRVTHMPQLSHLFFGSLGPAFPPAILVSTSFPLPVCTVCSGH